MAYTTLKLGSRGTDVTELQKALNQNGYSLAEDGIYGSKTQAAVRDYQQKNGLGVDGIVGTQTWGALNQATGATQTTQPSASASQTTTATPDYSAYDYDASSNEAYNEAMALLQQAQAEKPTYSASYDEQIDQLFSQIMNRDQFSYELNEDLLYQQMRDQYTVLGQSAMQDTIGQAAGLTGGYGSTYAQSVGQQQYDAYLRQLNEVVPELYGAAYDRYTQEGQDLLNQYSVATDAGDQEYQRYQDALSAYWTDVDYLTGRADNAYQTGADEWYAAQSLGMQQDETTYSRQQDAYDRLVTLIGSTGYSPSETELTAAGMSAAEAAAWRNAYARSLTSSSGSSSGDNSSSENASTASNAKLKATKLAAAGASATRIAGYLAGCVNAGTVTEDEAVEILSAVKIKSNTGTTNTASGGGSITAMLR